jgi:hypothetical protein
MVQLLLQRLLLPALTVSLVLTAAAPRNGEMTLWLATGDHAHVSVTQGRHREHSRSHALVHEHADESGMSRDDSHRHTCLEIGLPSGDWRASVNAGAGDQAESFAVPWAPPAIPGVVYVTPSLVPEGSRSTLGIPPPELLRTTILLI